jgi:hypothetical protein
MAETAPKGAEKALIKTIRISPILDAAVSALAEESGASFNSTLCLLIRLGLRTFK